jgi:hypothetical protein
LKFDGMHYRTDIGRKGLKHYDNTAETYTRAATPSTTRGGSDL